MQNPIRIHLRTRALFAAALAALPVGFAFAQTSWTGSANQSWSTATWSAGTPTVSSNITLNPGAVATLTVNTSAVGASLNFNSTNNTTLSISGANTLTLTGNVTRTGTGNGDLSFGSTTVASPSLTANAVSVRQITITNANSTNQLLISANSVATSGDFRLGALAGAGTFYTYGGNVTINGAQFLVNNANSSGFAATYTQTGGTLRATNTGGFGVVIGGEISTFGNTHGNNTFNLNGGAIEANRIGVLNANGSNAGGADRFGSTNGRLNFNEGTIRPLNTSNATLASNDGTNILTFENGRSFGSFNGTGTRDMRLNTNAPLNIALASTGNHTLETPFANSTIIVSPSARIVDQTTGGTLRKTGPGTLVITGGNSGNTNTWTGATTVTGGTLLVDHNRIAGEVATGGVDSLANSYSSASQLVLDGGNFSFTGRGSAAASSASGGSVAPGTFTQTVTNTAGLVIGQSVTNAFLPSGTYIRRIVSGTQIELSAMSTSTSSQSSQTLEFGAASFSNSQTINSVALNQSATVNVTPGTGDATTVLNFGDVSGAGGLTKAGTGLLRLTGNLTYSGPTALSAGTLEFAPASGTSTLSANVTGSGAIVKSGAGTTVIANAAGNTNNFSGNITVNGGVLRLGQSANSNRGMNSATAMTINTGGTVEYLRDAINSAAVVTVNSGGLLTAGTGGAFTNFSNLTLNGGTFRTGQGVSVNFQSAALGGNLTVTGTIASTIDTAGGSNNSLHLATTAATTRGFNVADVTNSSAADLTVSAVLTNASNALGAAGLEKLGTGTMVLSAANTYTGSTTVSAGTLALGANNVFADTSNMVLNGGTLSVGSFTDTVGSLDLSSLGGGLSLGSGGTFAFADSSALDWNGGSLSVTGTFISGSSLRFGTSSSGLTLAQLASISIAGNSQPISLDTFGYLTAVPEPSSFAALAGLGAVAFAGLRRRRRA